MTSPIVLVTTDRDLSDRICAALQDPELYRVSVAADEEQAVQQLRVHGGSMAFLDLGLGEQALENLGAALRTENPGVKLFVLAGEEIPAALDGIRPWTLVRKPYLLPDMLHALAPAAHADGGSNPPWLASVSSATIHMMRFLRESEAQCAVITRNHEVWAQAGDLNSAGANELAVIMQSNWDAAIGGELIRYINLQSTGNQHILYARRLDDENLLGVALDGTTPFSSVRTRMRILDGRQEDEGAIDVDAAILSTAPLRWTIQGETNAEVPAGGSSHRPFGGDFPDFAMGSDEPSDTEDWVSEVLPLSPPPIVMEDAVTKPSSGESDGVLLQPDQATDSPLPEPEQPVEDAAVEPSAADAQWNALQDSIVPDAEQSREAMVARVQPFYEEIGEYPEPDDENAVEPDLAVEMGDLEIPIGGATEAMLQPSSAGVYCLTYACLLAPRFPRHYLAGDIADKLSEWMANISVAFGWRLEFLSVRPEYLQWVANVTPDVSPESVVNTIRRHTSERLFVAFPMLKEENPGSDFWAPGYLIMHGPHAHPGKLVREYLTQVRRRQDAPANRG